MRLMSVLWPISTALTLGACASQSAEPDTVSDGFGTPSQTGEFPVSLVDNQSQAGIVPGAFAFQTGFQKDVGIRVFSGLLPDATVTGTATPSIVFNARFQGAIFEDLAVVPPQTPDTHPVLNGKGNRFIGDIPLTVSLDGQSLTGTARSDTGGVLQVDGMLNGQDMSGSVTYRGLTGPLTGLTGADRTIGAFYGISETAVYSGGFTGPVEN